MKIFQPIYGAVRLAQGKRDGMSLFGDSETDFWQSFYAAIIVAPLFFIFISLQSNTGVRSALSVNFYAIHVISYVVGWVLFPLVMIHLVKTIGRQQFYIRLIVAYNWASVVQNAVFLPFAILNSIFIYPFLKYIDKGISVLPFSSTMRLILFNSFL